MNIFKFDDEVAVKDILNDEEIRVAGLPEDAEITTPAGFKIIPKIDQSQVFSKVWQALKKGECIGIFPKVYNSKKYNKIYRNFREDHMIGLIFSFESRGLIMALGAIKCFK